MSDLISRKAALYSYQFEVCNKVKCYECKATDEDETCKLERWIKKLPSAERHGRWIENETSYADPPTKQTCNCSICGKASTRPLGDWCRWCGSRMDLDGDTE